MRRVLIICLGALALGAVAGGCGAGPDPLEAALPALPPEGGPAIAAAGRLTSDNFQKERVPGPAALGLPGDYFMRNDKIRVVVQAPGRAIGPCPYGGDILDADRVADPAGDQLGEVSAFLQLGRTVNFTRAEIVRDGKKGGPAVLRFRGHDALNNFINVPGLGSFALGIRDDYRAGVDLKLQIAVTYILMPGDSHVRAIFTFYNSGRTDLKTEWGTLTDTGAQIETFHAGIGFGEIGINDILAPTSFPLVNYVALLGQGIAYGIVPIYDDKTIAGAPFPVAGVDVEVYSIKDKFDALGAKGQTLTVPKHGTAAREVDFIVGRDVAQVTAKAHELRKEATVAFRGTVMGVGAAGARVAVSDLSATSRDLGLVTTLTADASGSFAGALPAGNYAFQAEGDGWRRGPEVQAALPAPGDLVLTIPDSVPLSYTIRDRSGGFIPGKVTVVGRVASPPDRRFRDTVKDTLPYGVAGWIASRRGDSGRGDRYDHPLPLVPGRYRVVVSRGPEWSRFEQVLTVGSGGARVDAILDHVVPTPGYAACDFHQHSHLSPDSPVPPEDRVVTYLADGVDFIASSEHDVHFDYLPLIDALDARDLLNAVPGVEVTPFSYGHFIGFPMSIDPLSPNGGAFDWAGGEFGPDLSPGQILDGLRTLGAKVVQVNHPRTPIDAQTSFQQNFDRAGLSFNFGTHSFGGDARYAPIDPPTLGLAEGAQLFSDHFDSLEIYNGFHIVPAAIDGERPDYLVDVILRDWMNFLSFGFTPAPVGDSDSHLWIAAPAGLPRTLVRVPDDSPAAIRAGIGDDVVATMSGRSVPKDVIVTNGPFLRFTVDGQSLGRLVTHTTAAPLAIHIEVQTAVWAPVDTVELFANNSFDVPPPRGTQAAPLLPALCFTSKASPSARCAMAIGGARPLTINPVETVTGVPASTRLELTVDATVDLTQLLARQRPGAASPDLWLVARATGELGLFPVIPVAVDPTVPMADLVETGSLQGRGIGALAFTNAIFVDTDGDGWKGPFQP